MSKRRKLIALILKGKSDANVSFAELCQLLCYLGFEERIHGSHHIFAMEGIEEILNLQPKGANAKIYQVKQVRNLFWKYKLGDEEYD